MTVTLCALHQELLDVIGKTLGGLLPDRTNTCSSIAELTALLNDPLRSADVTVLAAYGDDLEEFLRIETLLRETRLILILLDMSPQCIAQSHLLHPRFLACGPFAMASTRIVLAGMIETLSAREESDCQDMVPSQEERYGQESRDYAGTGKHLVFQLGRKE